MNARSALPDKDRAHRALPQNIRAEQGLLGTIITSAKEFREVESFLAPEHFFDPLHGRIYAEIFKRRSSGMAVDAVTLSPWFEGDPQIGEVGIEYLAKLCVAFVGFMAKSYALTIVDCAHRREMIELHANGMDDAFSSETPVGDLAAVSSAQLDRIVEAAIQSGNTKTSHSLQEAVASVIQRDREVAKLGGMAGISTGFSNIDERLGGMEPGSMYILAGRPGMGKTMLGLQIASNVAEAGVGVCFISLEMSANQLSRRMLARLAGVPYGVLRSGKLHDRQADAVVVAQKHMTSMPFAIEDQAGMNTAQIAARARAAHRKHGLGLIVVDHLHIVGLPGATERMGATWAIGQISNAFKRLAKDMNVPVLILAQLNRAVEGREDKRPSMADLRQSGEIEQDADAILLLYRHEYYMSKDEPQNNGELTPEAFQKKLDSWHKQRADHCGKAEVILAKVRDGETGTEKLEFNGALMQFSEVETWQ